MSSLVDVCTFALACHNVIIQYGYVLQLKNNYKEFTQFKSF